MTNQDDQKGHPVPPFFTNRRRFASGALASVLVAGTAMHARADEPALTIFGELTYLQRIALPADSVAVVEVRASDGTLVSEHAIELAGRQVPVAFTLDVFPGVLAPESRYVLRGMIVSGPLVRWRGEEVDVDPSARPADVGTLVLAMLEPPAQDDMARLQSGWRVETIDGAAVAAEQPVAMTFGADGSLSGRACNAFGGSYRVAGGDITFGRIVSTMMACAEPMMAQEHALFSALARAGRYAFAEDGALVLSDAKGDRLVVARPADGG